MAAKPTPIPSHQSASCRAAIAGSAQLSTPSSSHLLLLASVSTGLRESGTQVRAAIRRLGLVTLHCWASSDLFPQLSSSNGASPLTLWQALCWEYRAESRPWGNLLSLGRCGVRCLCLMVPKKLTLFLPNT